MATLEQGGNIHRIVSLLLLLTLVAGGYWLVDGVLLAKHQFYQHNIEQLQNRLQRYQALLNTREGLEAQIQGIQQNQLDKTYYLGQASPTLAATHLQQQAKKAVKSIGGSLVSTQILPVADESGFSKVAIRVQMTGDTVVIQKVLYALESARPLLFVDNFRVRSRIIRRRARDRKSTTEQVQLTLQLELSGYMRQGEG